MLRIIILVALVVGSAIAETKVPKGATEIEPGVHRYTEPSGKTYIYRKTPFGIVKSLEAPTVSNDEKKDVPKATPTQNPTATPFGSVKPPAKKTEVKVTEQGDTLEFERPSPFGSYKWKKNKNDLTPEEREAWSRQSSTAGSNE